ADRILAHEAHARRGWIGEAAGDGGDVAQADGAVAGADREVADVVDRGEGAVHAQLHALAGCFEEAARRHRVLLRQRLLDGRHRDAERGQPGIADLDPDPLVLQADQLDLADVVDALQLQLHAVGVVLEHGVVEALAGERVDVAEGVAELVVEERADHALGQGRADVADLLAHLVPELRHVARVHRVARHEDHLRFARPRVRADELVLAGLHQLVLDALGDLARDLLGGGARPQGAHHHRLEGERRVFRAPQLQVRQRAADGDHDHRVQHQAAVAQRPLGQVEAHGSALRRAGVCAAMPRARARPGPGGTGRHALRRAWVAPPRLHGSHRDRSTEARAVVASATGRLSRSTGVTAWPSRSRWPPAVTTRSSGSSPDSTGTRSWP